MRALHDTLGHDLDFLPLYLFPVCPLLFRPRDSNPSPQQHLPDQRDAPDPLLGLMTRRDVYGETERRDHSVIVHIARLSVDDNRGLVQVDRRCASFSSPATNELSSAHAGEMSIKGL